MPFLNVIFMGETNILYMTFPENLIFTRIICFKTEAGQSLFIKALLKRPEIFNYGKLGTRHYLCSSCAPLIFNFALACAIYID